MGKHIVERYTKIDLHIHSCASEPVDGKKVENNTKENIPLVLLPNLYENEINMVAITDHNTFSEEIYTTLKSYEGTGTLQKVLPGVELDIDFLGKDTHVILIFEDSNQEKIRNINSSLKKHAKKIDGKDIFEQNQIQSILEEIDLNVVVIAHQKCDVQKEEQESNLAQIGPEMFDKVISAEYFDSVEFKSLKVEGFLMGRMGQGLSNFKYLSGSDCHNWSVYPCCEKKKDSTINFTYIKSLPTFKGLVMAITGDNRISLVDVPLRAPHLEHIDFSLSGIPHSIPLSSGLNVLIGDNSVGKSLLLYGIVDPCFGNVTLKTKKEGYLRFCKSKNLQISKAFLPEKTYRVEDQGGIRQKFESDKTSIKDVDFIKEHFKPLNSSLIEGQISKTISSFVEHQELLDEERKASQSLDINLFLRSDLSKTTYRLMARYDIEVFDNTDYSALIANLSQAEVGVFSVLSENLNQLKEEDKIALIRIKKELNELVDKYKQLEREVGFRNSLFSEVTTAFTEFANEVKKMSTTVDKEITAYKIERDGFVQKITDAFVSKEKLNRHSVTIPAEILCSPVDNPVGKYNFRSCYLVEKIIDKDLTDMLCFPVTYQSNYGDLKLYGFEKLMKSLTVATINLIGTSGVTSKKEAYKAMCLDYAKKNWLKIQNPILDKKDDVSSNNSPGKNALYYLDIYSSSKGEQLYIVDQPEDDVSELRISTDLLQILRQMASKRQVLFITHNPELVVNLDVDNVIVLKQNEKKELSIFGGALEFEDGEMNILYEVATLLDGGPETIKRRWKRYAKTK